MAFAAPNPSRHYDAAMHAAVKAYSRGRVHTTFGSPIFR
jgi:hypothetical protein